MIETLLVLGAAAIFAGTGFLIVALVLAAFIRSVARQPRAIHSSRMVNVPLDDLPEPIRKLAQDLAESGAHVVVCMIEDDPFSQSPVTRESARNN